MLIKSTKKFEKQMHRAPSYQDWQEAARAHDKASGAERWKQMDPSKRFDYANIRIRLDKLRELRANGDNAALLFTLNEGIHGNMGGMGNASLYNRAKFGTKKLVSDYVTEINNSLEYLASNEASDISFEDKLDFFHRASHCYGRTALMMSGSGSLLYFHVGVLKALNDEELVPDVLSGSSGGAIIAAICGTHKRDELEEMFTPEFLLAEVRQETGLWENLSSIKPRNMSQDKVREVIERLVPDMTFQEAEQYTGRHVNVSVAPAEKHQTSRLLNSVASPNVYIHDSLLASAAVPGIYAPVTLMAKNVHGERQPYLPSRKWVDGSVSDDLPAKRLSRLYGVNHFVVSQTNPIATPFVRDIAADRTLTRIYRDALQRSGKEFLNANIEALAKPLSNNPMLETLAKTARSVINQKYTADINIIPSARLVNPLKLLSLRSEKEVLEMIEAGQRATWPKLEMIRVQTMISRTLDNILTEMEGEHFAQLSHASPQIAIARRRASDQAKTRSSNKKMSAVT